jgi:hypothetical protein
MTKRNYPYISFYSMRYDITLVKDLLKKVETKDNQDVIKNIRFWLNQEWKAIKRLQKWFDANVDIFMSDEDRDLWKLVDEYKQQLKDQGIDFKEIERIGKMCRDISKQFQEIDKYKVITTTGVKVKKD